jgi:hypothetical protein
MEGIYECCSFWTGFCPYTLMVEINGRKTLCNHPTKREICERTTTQ